VAVVVAVVVVVVVVIAVVVMTSHARVFVFLFSFSFFLLSRRKHSTAQHDAMSEPEKKPRQRKDKKHHVDKQYREDIPEEERSGSESGSGSGSEGSSEDGMVMVEEKERKPKGVAELVEVENPNRTGAPHDSEVLNRKEK
jgi:hypothetical protein